MAIQYVHHNTADDVTKYLNLALAILDDVDPPDDLRGLTYAKAVDLLAAKAMIGSPDVLPVAGIVRPH